MGMVSVGDLDENLREPDLGVVEAVWCDSSACELGLAVGTLLI